MNTKKFINNNLNDKTISINAKRIIFPKISITKLKNVMIDNESIKYITFADAAQEISNLIINNLSDFPCPENQNIDTWHNDSLYVKAKKLNITDMTAGIGGNVLNFANYFNCVNAIELDKTRFNYLTQNIKIYDFSNVSLINSDAIDVIINNDIIIQNIIFFDPPWGGKNYKYFTNLKLKLGNFDIEDICILLLKKIHNKILVLKLPNNYDFDHMMNVLRDYRITKYSMEKMTIIVIKNYPRIIY